MKFTVFGATGFIGGALSLYLEDKGHEVIRPPRGMEMRACDDLGHAIYAIGLTADFRKRPFETIEAHVGLLTDLLRTSRFDSWLYLSSTRVYGRTVTNLATESSPLTIEANADSVYDLSKLTGEALCHAQGAPRVRVARLANVYGAGQSRETFLGSLLADIAGGRDPQIGEAPTSSKDYVALSDVCALLESIALVGRESVYNVASGTPLTHASLGAALTAASPQTVSFARDAPHRAFPQIDISRIASEFNFHPKRLTDDLDSLVACALSN